MTDRLYRSVQEKMIGGVCGGLADYFNIDTALVRLIFLVAAFAGGVGFLAYLAAWVIVPVNPGVQSIYPEHLNSDIGIVGQEKASDVQENHENRSKFAGGILVILGTFFLLERLLPRWFDMSKMWPLLLIVIGLAIIWRGGRK
jgi:Putative stress-responsive transcriptional regulator